MESSKNGIVDIKDCTEKNVTQNRRPPKSNQDRKQKQAHAKVSKDDVPAPIPPDGGWGWVVTFSSFMVGFLVDGICFTFGFFFKEFMDYFGSNKSTTSSISSVLNGTYLSIGPIAAALVNKFGCRPVAIAGAAFAAASFFISTFSPNIQCMILFYGFCGGVGFGFFYLPSIVMVGYYFDKKRALATGMAVCGSGIGSFVFAPLCEYLLAEFDWKGSMWIISALVLNGMVFAGLFRPLTFSDDDLLSNTEGTTDKNICDIKFHNEHDLNVPVFNPSKEELKNASQNPIFRCRSMELTSPAKDNKTNKASELARIGHSLFLDESGSNRHSLTQKHILNPLVRKDIFYSGSIHHLPEYTKAGGEVNFVKSMLSTSTIAVSEGSEKSKKCDCMKNVFAGMFDISLLKSPTFILYGLSCFLCMIGFFVPFTYIPDLAEDFGMSSSQSAWLISTIGILNCLGRIGVGFVSDKSWADCIFINIVALIAGGATTMFVPFYRIYWILLLYTIVFGTCIAAFVSLRSIIIVELLGIEKLTNSFGFIVLCQGLSTFIGSPIAGALSDATGDYKASFYLAGGVIALSGIICIPLRRISQWERRRSENQQTLNDLDTEIKPMLSVSDDSDENNKRQSSEPA